ncbi:MAG: ABC transporter ATP-binding protein [bacterium]
MNSPEVVIQTEALTRRFGQFVAVDSVSFEVKRGEIFGFLGANGAGKTTTIRMLCGLLQPSAGRASVAGLDVKTQSEHIKRKIGYMSQRFSLYEDLTIIENIEFYAGIYGLNRSQRKQKPGEVLAELGLGIYSDTLTADLPLGFKQRLALGCAMLHNPPILFLDEPTSGVDPRVRRSFWEVIYRKAAQGTTILVTTHFMEESEYCHRVMIMDEGRIIAMNAPDDIKKQYGKSTMQEVFSAIVDKKLNG